MHHFFKRPHSVETATEIIFTQKFQLLIFLHADCTRVPPGESREINLNQEGHGSKAAKYAETPETFFCKNTLPNNNQATPLQRALTQALVPSTIIRRKVLYLKLAHQVSNTLKRISRLGIPKSEFTFTCALSCISLQGQVAELV